MVTIGDGGTGRRLIGWLDSLRKARRDDATALARPAAQADVTVAGSTLLEAAVAGLPDAVVVLDQDGRVLAHNAEASVLAPALRRGEPVVIALRTPELIEAIRAAQASGKAQRVEFSARLPAARWSEAFIVPIARQGEPGIVVITVHDLTPLRRVEEMRADFVANVSHELRTPLAALTGFIETLQ